MSTNVILIGGFYGVGKSYLTKRVAPLLPHARVLDLGVIKREANPHYDPCDLEQSAKLRKDVWDLHLPNALTSAINEGFENILIAGTFSTRARRDAIIGIAESQPGTLVQPFYLMPPMKTVLNDIRQTRVGPTFMVNDSTMYEFYRNLSNDFRANNNGDLTIPDPALVPREYRALLQRSLQSNETPPLTPWMIIPERITPEFFVELIRERDLEGRNSLLEGRLRTISQPSSKER